ncbi:methyltransferase domain-containing protein [Aequorivita sp. SDUM287046]|uniref:Methyltransferase domain-containing protein n=1 Tax=Aequorivita aurantiaca TaxID=3053356 RepID=A0ABT8DIP1_9FLAO|nr:methyltransferase domain-containing protein [Aequorivita aurantiaca]MDN3724782.1 methyltransferase domain-containing protein [Aequorivita aurantiaca]
MFLSKIFRERERERDLKSFQYFPVDKFEPGYDYFSLTKNFDLLNKVEPTEQFSFIICNHVLEHIIDDITAITNLFKILKKGGTAIVSVPILEQNAPTYEDYSITSPNDRKLHFGQWDHVRYYGTDIENRFVNVGFKVKTISSLNYFTEIERKTFGVSKNQYVFHLIKI